MSSQNVKITSQKKRDWNLVCIDFKEIKLREKNKLNMVECYDEQSYNKGKGACLEIKIKNKSQNTKSDDISGEQ